MAENNEACLRRYSPLEGRGAEEGAGKELNSGEAGGSGAAAAPAVAALSVSEVLDEDHPVISIQSA